MGKSVTELIQDGAVLEDSPFWCVVNHFHYPRLSWDQAGLWPQGKPNPIAESSVVWSQNTSQGPLYGGKASWHQAREAYYKALTESSAKRSTPLLKPYLVAKCAPKLLS